MESIKYKIALNEMYDIIVDRLTEELILNREASGYKSLNPCEVAAIIKREDAQIKQLAADYVKQNLNDEDVNKISFVDHVTDIINFPFKRGNYICPIFPVDEVNFYEHAYIIYYRIGDRLVLDLSLNYPNDDGMFGKIIDKYYKELREAVDSFASDWPENITYVQIRNMCRIENGIFYLNGKEYKIE